MAMPDVDEYATTAILAIRNNRIEDAPGMGIGRRSSKTCMGCGTRKRLTGSVLRQLLVDGDARALSRGIAAMLRGCSRSPGSCDGTKDREEGELVAELQAERLLQRRGGRLNLAPKDVANGAANLQKLLGVERARTLSWYRTGLRCELVARVLGPFGEGGGGYGFFVPRRAISAAWLAARGRART